MESGKIIVVANQKGGVAKTSTVRNLSYALAEMGKKVLVVDFDPQYNLTTSFGVLPTQAPYNILLENVPGLAPTSLLLLEQLRTIDRKRLRGYIGRISKEKMLEVDVALAISIGIGYPNERRTHNV